MKVGIQLKKIILIFLSLVIASQLFLYLSNSSWLPFGTQGDQAEVTDSTSMIEIDVSGVSTTIISESRSDLKTDLEGKGNVTVTKHGDSIQVEYKRKWYELFSGFNSPKLTVYLPVDYNRDMELDIGSGSLDFSDSGMKLNTLSLDVDSGQVHLKELSAGEFNHEVSSGSVTIESLAVHSGKFEVSSGKVDIKNYSGKLDADVSSGKFDVQMDKLTDSIDIKVSSGMASLGLPNEANFTLNGKVSSGIIRNDFPLNEATENKNHVGGTHGTGEHKVDISVSSGMITIN
ncbi:DUF4097 family beta strand repeat-containing protein [Metabacillus herbersteinensis]|uniref:DUF4097 family beta strand repeat-containing protein n=1 Tax=Metabacillus herbersteinensis TaxID=283816 RepID=A0ABV6GBM2_9BACI